MFSYGNSYGYGNAGSCGCSSPCQYAGCMYPAYGNGGGYAIILVLFILLIIILGARGWN